MRIALTRAISDRFADCELTHLERVPIDVEKAREQHRAYEAALAEAGYDVRQLPATDDMPDSVFIEDTAVVLDELALVMRPGARSRRIEVPAVETALREHKRIARIAAPATVDGGDVLVAGRSVFVGQTTRTNEAAVAQLRATLMPYGYRVCGVPVRGCLHLKSAATCVADGVLLLNPEWIDARAFAGFDVVAVDPREPEAANALRLDDRVIFPVTFPRTLERLTARGLRVCTVDASELAKAEGAVTCCSLIVA